MTMRLAINDLTEDARSLVVQALREKADADRKLAGRAHTERLAAQFIRQADQAAALADVIEGAERIAVHG